MNPLLIRAVIFLLVVGLFIRYAYMAPPRSRKQSAYGLAAAAFIVFTLINGAQGFGINTDPVLFPALILAVLLLSISVVQLTRAWRGGEMDNQMEQVRQALEEERQRRKERDEQRNKR